MFTATESDAEFVVIDDVPIFRECTSKDKDGNAYAIDKAILDQIAAVNNRRSEIGEPAVLHVGHNDDTNNEKPVWGFVTGYYTALRDGAWRLFSRWQVYAEKRGELKYFPRRSVELFEKDAPESQRWVIPSIALVGSNKPALDLGVVYCDQKRSHLGKFTYTERSMDGTNEVMVSDEMKSQILAVLSQTDVFKYVHDQMATKTVDAEVPVDSEVAEPEAEATDPGTTDGGGDVKPEEKTDDEAPKDEPKVEAEANESEGEEAAEDKKRAKEDAAKYTQLQAERDELLKKFTAIERENLLRGLESQGHVFDVAAELAESADLDEAQFQKFIVARIKKYTKRAPVAKKFTVASVNSGGETSTAELNNRINRAKKFARQHGCTFQAALDQVT